MGFLNEQGNWVVYDWWPLRERDYYDAMPHLDPYSTDQDAPYFGVWIDWDNRVVVSFAEGDETVAYCINDYQFQLELEAVDNFYQK